MGLLLLLACALGNHIFKILVKDIYLLRGEVQENVALQISRLQMGTYTAAFSQQFEPVTNLKSLDECMQGASLEVRYCWR
jgi:hypothetical protein